MTCFAAEATWLNGNIGFGRTALGVNHQESAPEFIRWAVVALAVDPDMIEKSGRVLAVGGLARAYGFTDLDGRQVPPFRVPDDYLQD